MNIYKVKKQNDNIKRWIVEYLRDDKENVNE